MDDLLTDRLKETFPELFVLIDVEKEERHMPISYFGVECDNGWYNIIYALSYQITKLCEDAGVIVPELHQVKEKFGGLRYYLSVIHEDVFKEVHDLVVAAEEDSFEMCEGCGTTEGVETCGGGWIETCCGKCRDQRQKERVERYERHMKEKAG